MAEEILAVLTDRPGLYGIKGLFRELGLSRKRYNEYRQTLHNLLDNGQIVHLGRRRLAVRKKPKIIQGILRLTPHGYGFIDRQEDSIFINAREARKAFDGDLVEVEVIDRGHEAGPEGRILNVEAENRQPLLAVLRKKGAEWFAEVKSGPLNFSARVDGSINGNNFSPGDMVTVSVPGTRRRYPLPNCSILKRLGDPQEKGVAEKGLMASAGLKEDYPAAAIQEATQLKAESSRSGVRQNLRDEFVITIDPADAKDHDDAVSLRRDDDGNYLLGVHIADVSRYVRADSVIDKEARSRGFSIYLQHHHLPMLPPRLPGELCSLKPGKDRLALSALLRIDPEGKVIDRRIIPSLVRIRRLTSYETAQKYLDGKGSAKSDPELRKQLRSMWKLASALKKRRLEEGGVDFDLPEAGFYWESGAAPRRIFQQPRLQSHQLIEEFMLAANRAVAEVWVERFGTKSACVFRVHPPPDAEKRQKLADYLADAGFDWPAEKLTTTHQIASMLDEARRRFPEEVTAVIARKALMLARYEAFSKGHFGLGFKRYLHFTSPIRRYADLTVHRLIWRHLIKGHNIENKDKHKEILENLCLHLGEREKRIAELEREAAKLSGLLYLNERRHDTFPARLVEAAQDKLFVSLEGLFLEGFLTPDSGIQFLSRRRQTNKYPRRQKGSRALAIGDKLNVAVAKIDLLNRKLELRAV